MGLSSILPHTGQIFFCSKLAGCLKNTKNWDNELRNVNYFAEIAKRTASSVNSSHGTLLHVHYTEHSHFGFVTGQQIPGKPEVCSKAKQITEFQFYLPTTL